MRRTFDPFWKSTFLFALGAIGLLLPNLSRAQLEIPERVQVDAMLQTAHTSVHARKLIKKSALGERTYPVLIEGPVATGMLQALGVLVQTDAAGIRTARVPESALQNVLRLPGVERVTLGYPLRPHLNGSVRDTEANHKRSDEPPLQGFNGTDVIIGIVDSGIDFSHEDFQHLDGTTRVLYIWDQNAFGTPPGGYGYGNECTEAQINAGTCTQLDFIGHGSHVAGIAVGDGSIDGGEPAPPYTYVGMANNADIIAVATDFSFAGVVDAVNYVFQKADSMGKPAVVNLSLGTPLGPHDGTLPFELQLNALIGPGKIIVASAGNTQDDDIHASAEVQSTPDTLDIDIAFYQPIPGTGDDFLIVDMWHDQANFYNLTVLTPIGATVGPVAKGGLLQTNTGDGRITINYTSTNNPNGQSNILIEISDDGGTPPFPGDWQIIIQPINVPGPPIVHAWMEGLLGDLVPAFPTFTTHVDTTMNVEAPGSATDLITVGAYTTRRAWSNYQDLVYNFTGSVNPFFMAPFSARGPRRDGVLKPEIVAPGTAIVSVMSDEATPPYGDPFIMPGENHVILQGTSMAAPHVSGAVAMMLQEKPTLTTAQIKTELFEEAREDEATGPVPNSLAGHGKLDLTNVLCDLEFELPTTELTAPVPGNAFYPGTPTGVAWDLFDMSGLREIVVDYRLNTGGSWTEITSFSLPDDEQFHFGSEAFTPPGQAGDSIEVRVRAWDCPGNVGTATSGFLPVLTPTVDAGGDLPLAFAAHRAAPNPFTDQATLRFDLPAGAGPQGWPVDVSIYNVAGRKVRTIVHSNLAPGRYAYAWDGRDNAGVSLAAGVYFVEIKAGPNSARQQVVRLR